MSGQFPSGQFSHDGLSWHAPLPPDTTSVDLQFGTIASLDSAAVARWQSALAPPPLEVRSAWPSAPATPVVSVPIVAPVVRARSFIFPEPNEIDIGDDNRRQAPSLTGPSLATKPSGGSTRITPPGDVIKLEDRLHYLLQPSLQSLLAERSMAFPFHPFPFQFEGIAFLYPRHAAILADEMGLGKTMQAITTVRLLLRCSEIKTVLLVCPKPLVTNWQREFELWAPEVPVSVIEGPQTKRTWQWQLPDVPVRIANYELLCRDRELLRRCDEEGWPSVRFDLVVLDESQRIKNRTGTTSQVVRSISRRRSWALTGTPVENSADDLVGIFEFLAPGFLSPDMKPRRMGRTIADHVLRRTKDEVLTDLPPKMFRDAEMDLSAGQRESYRLAESDGVLRLTEMGGSATIQHIFELVLRLKQICNFDPATGTSSKLERLTADLEEIADSGGKAIVFSQWVETLRTLARHVRPFGPLEYHGKVPPKRRDAVINRFRDDDTKHVMLMSYGAGSVGLNLQFANYVFLFDRWWNPAVEDQA
ncbi:MAG: DEAD/DEAH box helicase, partial [Candidatus Nealsonbacteria bacterium]|nr:DEAD/DEAH box helicase [Candidatus Nealsonbacteria bacterium]